MDDILVTSNDQNFVSSLISQLQVEFAMKDLGQLTYFLGIQATRTSTGLHLRQTRYIINLLDRVQLTGIRPYRAPCVSGSKLSKFDGELLSDPSEYRHTVGALQYVTLTRPDISYSVNQLVLQHVPTSLQHQWIITLSEKRWPTKTSFFNTFPPLYNLQIYLLRDIQLTDSAFSEINLL